MSDIVKRKTILDTDIDTFETAETVAVVKQIQESAKRATANESASKNSFPLRPSSALKGARDLYYALENWAKPGTIPTTDIEGRNCMLLNLGHVIEKHLVDQIKQAFKVPFTAQKLEYGKIMRQDGTAHILGGEADFFMEMPSTGEVVLCDSKSSADFPFRKAEAKDEHVVQLTLYMHSDFCRQRNVNRAWIFYYSKNTSDIRIHEFFYDSELAKRTIERLQNVYTMWERRELPPQEFVLSADWQANYSNFRDYEWKAYSAPRLSRNIITLSETETFALPRDKKDLLRHVVKKYGIQVLKTADGREIFAIKRGDAMFLTVEDADGFSS